MSSNIGLEEWVSDWFSGVPSNVAVPIVIGIIATLFLCSVIAIIYGVLHLIATWRMFKAGGEGGWKSLIPFLNQYTLDKLTWSKRIFWVSLILAVSGVLLFCIGTGVLLVPIIRESGRFVIGDTPGEVYKTLQRIFSGVPAWQIIVGGIIVLIGELIMLALCVIRIISYYHVSKAYNHGVGYFFGLLLFPAIFWLIIGFDGNLKYCGNAAARKGIQEPAPQPAPAPAPAPYTPYVPYTPAPAPYTPPVAPEAPAVPETPAMPEAPAVPEAPVVPETPVVPEAPVVPETPVVPEAPVIPETPVVPEAPVIPETPVVSETPVVPETPAVPEEPMNKFPEA